VMAKQRQSAAPAAVMQLPEPRWQAKSLAMPRALLPQVKLPAMRRALLQARSMEMRRTPLGANSRGTRRVLFQPNSRVKTVDPPSQRLRRAGWRPPLPEAQD
jgi:hypothetical protein